MKPTKKKIWFLCIFLIIVLLFLLSDFFRLPRFIGGPVHGTRFTLIYARNMVNAFKIQNGRCPNSLMEAAQWGLEQRFDELPFKESLSGSKNSAKEFNVLNGEGGWYYDPNTGEVKVNLTKPVKHYWKFCFGKKRNEIPAEW